MPKMCSRHFSPFFRLLSSQKKIGCPKGPWFNNPCLIVLMSIISESSHLPLAASKQLTAHSCRPTSVFQQQSLEWYWGGLNLLPFELWPRIKHARLCLKCVPATFRHFFDFSSRYIISENLNPLLSDLTCCQSKQQLSAVSVCLPVYLSAHCQLPPNFCLSLHWVGI